VVRRASCGLQLQASPAWLLRCRRVGARCLWGGDAALELASRARRAAMVMVGPYPTKGRCDGETVLPFGLRPWCDVPAAAFSFMPAPRGSRDAGASALAVSGKEAQHSTLLRTRRAALVLTCLLPANERCASERPLSFGAQPWCDVSAAASSAKPVSCHAAQARKRSLSLGRTGAALELVSRAYRAAIVVEGSSPVVCATLARGLSVDAAA